MKHKMLLIIFLAFISLCSSAYALSAQYTPTAENMSDSYIVSVAPNNNYGTGAGSQIGYPGTIVRAFFNFTYICDLLGDVTYNNVTLRLYADSSSEENYPEVYEFNRTEFPDPYGWSEAAVTWNNCGVTGCDGWYNTTSILTSRHPFDVQATTYYNLSIKAESFQHDCANRRRGFIIKGTEINNHNLQFYTSDETTESKKPVVYIEYILGAPVPQPSVNISYPLNASFNRQIPMQFNYSFSNFNATNCTAYHNLTRNYSQFYSIKSGQFNITTNITIVNLSYNPYIDAFYRLEEGSGSNIIDSMLKNNATNINNASYQSSKGSNNTGLYSMQFNGVSQYLNQGTIGNYERTQPFSITFWIKTSSTPVASAIIAGKIDNVGYRGWEIFQTNLGVNFALLNALSNYAHVRATNFTINNNAWHFVTIIYSGSSTASGISVYIDNNLQGLDVIKDNLGGTILTSQTFKIGADSTVSAYYNGYLDEISLWNITLNTSQITDIYNNGVSYLINNSYTYSNTSQINQTLNSSLLYNFSYYYPDNTIKNLSFYINCFNGADVNSSLRYFSYDNDFTAPDIIVYSPNISYNETYNATIYINFSLSEPASCSLNSSDFTLNYSNATFYAYKENSGLSSGFNSIAITCYDPSGNYAIKEVYFTKDITYPVIFIYSPANNSILSNKAMQRINISMIDDRDLYDYFLNITYFDDDTEEYVSLYSETGNISGYKHYNISKMINMSLYPNNTLFTLAVRTCDSHTNNNMESAKNVKKEKDKLTFDFKNNKIAIKSSDSINANSEKMQDRYTFSFRYAKASPFKSFNVVSELPLHYLKHSEYKGHFVTGNHWIDFEDESGDNEISVLLISDYEANITINSKDDNEIKFKSIGELNCIETSHVFSKSAIVLNNPFGIDFNLANTGNVIFFFALAILFIGVWIIAYWFKNFGFASLGFFIGIIMGLLLVNIHLFFFFMFTFINVVLFIQFGRNKK